jgi:hypothetical protein
MERLLARVSASAHADRFLLKGALLFALWYEAPHRPTRDADLLGFGPDDAASLIATFREVASIDLGDAIVFDPESVRAGAIRENSTYGGTRISLVARIGSARCALQIDVGFGDAVTPEPQTAIYPTLLDDFQAPRLRVYPVYTVIAEKYQAMVMLGQANTRMKDFFDLEVIATDGTGWRHAGRSDFRHLLSTSDCGAHGGPRCADCAFQRGGGQAAPVAGLSSQEPNRCFRSE